ncbi:MAG TPA: dipeptidase [Acidimicrobiia bacterium]|nr:dipeptidase [Acidimicrobiia bacterium]
MHEDLRTAIDNLFPSLQSALEDLVRIPSISAPSFDAAEVRRSAEAVADLLSEAGFETVRLLEVEGAHPAVFAEIPGPDGAPTVLLYAHHDVQPVGDPNDWDRDPFDPVEVGGRLYGRGSSDDKAGLVVHLGAVKAHNGRPPVGVKVIVEGEEEIGSTHLGEFLSNYRDLLAADVIVIADSGNWRVGQPALTTSLRGLVDCTVEVRTLRHAVHSGLFGGVIPDALTVLARLLATLHDADGNVAIPGLVFGESDTLDLTEEEMRSQADTVEGLELIGSGPLTSRIWTQPAVAVLAIDAPAVGNAVNALVPAARAKVSLRIAPGDNPEHAMSALVAHLEQNVEWGAEVNVIPGVMGEAFALKTTGRTNDAFRAAFEEAWGRETVNMGVGGSIPFVAAFSETFPNATILLTGVADPTSRAHGPNESVDLDDVKKGALAEAIALRLLAR